MDKVQWLFDNREQRAKETRAQGAKVLGYLCCFAPMEIMSAAGLMPFRIMGRPGDEVVQANSLVESMGCPYVRNCFEQALLGNLDFTEGLVISHSCDMVQRVYGPWKSSQKPAYSYLFNAPHKASPWSIQFFERELLLFKESLEKFTGSPVSDEAILQEIQVSNENRALVRELYDLRSRDAALTGVEMQRLLVVGMSVPAREFNGLLKEVRAEVQARPRQASDAPRILVWGSIIDHPKLYQIIEDAGGSVVGDDNCIGTRCYFNPIDTTEGVWRGLTKAYFEDFQCPRTDRGPGMARFDYVLDLVARYRVQGVVCYTYSFCDPHQLDYPDLRDLLESRGIPTLAINDDYTLGNIETIANRVLPFLEAVKAGADLRRGDGAFTPAATGTPGCAGAAAAGCAPAATVLAGCGGCAGRRGAV
jgi:bzd-type benzoyl-CoA reductase N subunit